MNRLNIETPLGPMLIAADPDGLLGSWFMNQRHFPAEARNWPVCRTDLLANAESQLHAYLAGERQTFDLPLAPRGTPFQRSVWELLRAIPYAESTTYGQIAASLGKPSAARAVGMAVGRNPWTLIVPCHRVVGSNGTLTGYAGGLERKQRLQDMEKKTSTEQESSSVGNVG